MRHRHAPSLPAPAAHEIARIGGAGAASAGLSMTAASESFESDAMPQRPLARCTKKSQPSVYNN